MSRFVVTAALVCMGSLPALAQDVCAERTAILQSLAQDYKEHPSAMGMSNGGNVVEVFTARNGKTWTILVTRPDGKSCVVAAGEQWTQILQQLSSVDDTI